MRVLGRREDPTLGVFCRATGYTAATMERGNKQGPGVLGLVGVAAGLWAVLAASNCGRVSFYQDGLKGDAGLGGFDAPPRPPRSSSSRASSVMGGGSTSSGGGVVSSSGPTCDPLGPRPAFAVVEGDVNANFWSGWTSCNGCHGPPGATQFTPAMPAPMTDPTATVALLNSYCQTVEADDPATLTADAGLHRLKLICPLLSPTRNDGDFCDHTASAGGQRNNKDLVNPLVVNLMGPCTTALARHQDEINIWLDGGYAPDCGTLPPPPSSSSAGSGTSVAPGSSSGGGGGSTSDMPVSSSAEPSSSAPPATGCPRPGLQASWDVVWAKAGAGQRKCVGCHQNLPSAACFPMPDSEASHTLFCNYAMEATGTAVAATFEESKLYLSTLGGNARYACAGSGQGHVSFYGGGLEDDVRAWFDAIYTAP